MERLSSAHWVCLFLKDVCFNTLDFWQKLEDSAPFSRVLLFGLLCLQYFWRRLQNFQQIISPANFCASCWIFPLLLIFSRHPLLLLGCQPCPNWTVYWGLYYILEGHFDGSISLTFSDKTSFWLQAMYWEISSLTSFFLVSWRRRFIRVASLLFERIFCVSIFHHVVWGGEDKIEVIEKFVSNVLLVFITDLPCHVVTLKSFIRVSYDCFI